MVLDATQWTHIFYLSILPEPGNLLLEPGALSVLPQTPCRVWQWDRKAQTQVVETVSVLNQRAFNDTQLNIGALNFKNL